MAETMNAVVRRSGGAEHAPVPRPVLTSAEDVLVRVSIVGICRTDLFAAEGTLPVADGRILGHELAGTVEGRRVAIVPSIPCGACDGCARRPERCGRAAFLGVDADGAFAPWVRVPRACTIAVPESLEDREVAFVEPLAAALAVIEPLASFEPRDILVLGGGRIATLVARVIEAWRGRPPDVALEHEAGADAYDAVIETVPTGTAFDRALRALRPRGRLILKSRPAERVPIDVALAVRREITMIGARYAPFESAIEWLASRRVAVSDLLGPTYPLARFAEAFTHARRADAPKIFLQPAHERA
jgi:L-iditol 2-dehydrogenase